MFDVVEFTDFPDGSFMIIKTVFKGLSQKETAASIARDLNRNMEKKARELGLDDLERSRFGVLSKKQD